MPNSFIPEEMPPLSSGELDRIEGDARLADKRPNRYRRDALRMVLDIRRLRAAIEDHISDGHHTGPRSQRLRDVIGK